MSDMSVSSVHTSDLSDFDDDDDDATTIHSSSVKGDDVDMDISSSSSDDMGKANDDGSSAKDEENAAGAGICVRVIELVVSHVHVVTKCNQVCVYCTRTIVEK